MDDFNKMVQKQLFDLADEKYRKFSSGLLPNVDNILGVRLPELRKLAKKIAKDDWRNFLNSLNFICYIKKSLKLDLPL